METFHHLVREYEKKCKKADVPEETVLAFLVEITQRERYDLYARYEEEMPEDVYQEFTSGMERILKGEPMAHVLGYSWFYGYKLIADDTVLIPRYETEELCANVLMRMDELFPDAETIECVDVGTGSGAIAITLCKEEEKVRMMASDISEEALATAKKNAENNEANISFYQGDMLKPFVERGDRFDVLVCNPPYIPENEEMEHSVVDFEPNVALFGGKDGLKFYRSVFEDCHKVMKEKSFMAFEMGWNQKEKMEALIKEILGEVRYEIVKDMNGKDRMLFVYFGN
ncbi:MAG: peptide chain release factor N(5)-glutamine methyltransferase [Solobacterium sp.]|nr:peptide chain release factor N(5)-glutamine methyltransferase [Solobacterium sp.]